MTSAHSPRSPQPRTDSESTAAADSGVPRRPRLLPPDSRPSRDRTSARDRFGPLLALLTLAAFGSVAWGAALLSVPAGFITGGVLLFVFVLILARGSES